MGLYVDVVGLLCMQIWLGELWIELLHTTSQTVRATGTLARYVVMTIISMRRCLDI